MYWLLGRRLEEEERIRTSKSHSSKIALSPSKSVDVKGSAFDVVCSTDVVIDAWSITVDRCEGISLCVVAAVDCSSTVGELVEVVASSCFVMSTVESVRIVGCVFAARTFIFFQCCSLEMSVKSITS